MDWLTCLDSIARVILSLSKDQVISLRNTIPESELILRQAQEDRGGDMMFGLLSISLTRRSIS
jgi:hypothetical protein